jgi:Zn-dependent protease
MVEFKLFGIPVRVMPIFWITLGLIGLIGSDIRDALGLLDIALFVLAGFLSILIHEMGHALMIKKYKLPTQIVLASFGGYAVYPAGSLNRLQSFLVTAAGPAAQLAVAYALAFALPFFSIPPNKFLEFLIIFIFISKFWAFLNCLPIMPLDGGQMLAAIMGPRRRAGLHLTGVVTAAIMAVVALQFGAIFGVLFMGMFAWQNYQAWQQTKGQ